MKHGGNADESATDISIVMTAFNAEAYVEEAIHSILQQQTSRRWELLFVDDGSTDKPWKLHATLKPVFQTG